MVFLLRKPKVTKTLRTLVKCHSERPDNLAKTAACPATAFLPIPLLSFTFLHSVYHLTSYHMLVGLLGAFNTRTKALSGQRESDVTQMVT